MGYISEDVQHQYRLFRTSKGGKGQAWLALDRLAPLLQKARFEDGDVEKFEVVVIEFYTSYEKAWDVTNLTQYMVIT